MQNILRSLGSRHAAFALLIVASAAYCLLNYPGHVSLDSIVHLYEGRTGIYASFNPPFVSFLFGLADKIIPGTGLLMLVNVAMFTAATTLLIQALPRTTLQFNAALAIWLLSPITVIYNGIAWKDVMFANFSLCAFMLILSRSLHHKAWKTALIITLLSCGSLIRQQGLIVSLIGCVTMAYSTPIDNRFARYPRLLMAAVFLLFSLALSKLLFWYVAFRAQQMQVNTVTTGIMLLMLYDIAGMTHNAPTQPLSHFAAMGVDVVSLKQAMLQQYTAQRIDTLNLFPPLPAQLTFEDVWQQWLAFVTTNPLAYLAHRLTVFSWQLGLHDKMLCVPVYVGMETSPTAMLAALKLEQTAPLFSDALYHYGKPLFQSPVFGGYIYLLASFLVCIKLAPRWRQHLPVLGLTISGILFAFSYLFIGIACDLRYIYFMIMATGFCSLYCIAHFWKHTED